MIRRMQADSSSRLISDLIRAISCSCTMLAHVAMRLGYRAAWASQVGFGFVV